jgi:hypothetical protein
MITATNCLGILVITDDQRVLFDAALAEFYIELCVHILQYTYYSNKASFELIDFNLLQRVYLSAVLSCFVVLTIGV